jgi:hypothetical protein
MSKYEPLTAHLKNLPYANYHITFKDIEKIIATPLPASAYQYRAWWSNNPSNSVMTKAWLNAGWISSDVDLAGQKLVFRRKKPATAASPPPSSSPAGERSIYIEGLAPEALAALETRARLGGKSVAEAARGLIEAHAALSATERLALADSIRAQSPKLHHIDVPGLIRDDRSNR